MVGAISKTETALQDLGGLTLRDAFLRYVLQSPFLSKIRAQLLREQPGYSPIFHEGQAPGPIVRFGWKLNKTAADLAADFGRPIAYFLGGPRHQPSDLESAAATLMVDRIDRLLSCLSRGELIAIGTFVGTGAEVNISRGQWQRTSLVLDVLNSDICETLNNQTVAVWTGVWLKTADRQGGLVQPPALPPGGERHAKTRKQVMTTDKARRDCTAWLLSMISDESAHSVSKANLWATAKENWPDKLAKRQFENCWDDALTAVTDAQRVKWTRPGPRRRPK